VEQRVILNLFGENDWNIYTFSRVGLVLTLGVIVSLVVYSYFRYTNMIIGYYDTFSSIATNLDHDQARAANLNNDSNFL